MNGENPAARRKLESSIDAPRSMRAERHLRELERTLSAAEAAYMRSEHRQANQLAQEVVGHAFMAVAHLVKVGDATGRERLRSTADWLRAARVFPDDMEQLVIALEALARGDTLPLLRPKLGGRQGGTRRTFDRPSMRAAVEAAREIKRHCIKYEEYRAELKACGTAPATIDGYAKKLAGSRHQPRSSYLIAHGTSDPKEVLGQSIEALNATSPAKTRARL